MTTINICNSHREADQNSKTIVSALKEAGIKSHRIKIMRQQSEPCKIELKVTVKGDVDKNEIYNTCKIVID